VNRRPTGPLATLCLVSLVGLLVVAAPVLVRGQGADATPTAASEGITLVASALTNPRGFTWGEDGALYVALAGTGGPRPDKINGMAAGEPGERGPPTWPRQERPR